MCVSRTPKPRGGGAFTLVELLVVVSIIALLIGILVPTLRKAQNQARVVACQANLSGVNKALIVYFLDYDSIPILLTVGDAPTDFGWCSWSFGGWSGRNKAYYRDYASGKFYIPTPQRPLSVHMYPKNQLEESTELPIFRCPADTVSSQGNQLDNSTTGETPFSAYDDVGTSYQVNYFWWRPPIGGLDYLTYFNYELGRGRAIWKKYSERGAARFVTLVEDPADAALRVVPAYQKQVMGFHREFSKHNFAFLDGHVSYVNADTRYDWGPEWTVNDESPTPESLQPPR